MRLLNYILIFTLLLAAQTIYGQDEPSRPGRRGSRIIDDTTKQIYGPNTSKYYFEEDVFYNRNIIHPIDTFIRNWHRWNFVQRNNNFYQDLGVVGSAIQPIFYQVPDQIGVRSGFDVYDLYWDTEQVKYYDTKSPYSNMNVVLGGKGRSLTRATFSRNVTPRWNLGGTYKGMFIDKQVPERQGKGDRVARSNYYDFYTAYHTKDSIYRLFANFQRVLHRVFESGGVNLSNSLDTTRDAYFTDNLEVWLSEAETNDHRMNMHFSHQVQLARALQIYHTFDRYRQKTKFLDQLDTDADYFNFVLLKDANGVVEDSTQDVAKFKVVRNEVGVKGNLLKLFYNGYYAIRHYNMTYNHYWLQDSILAGAKGDEHYLGGRMELRLDSIGVVSGWAEINSDSAYRIEGSISSKWFDASIRQLNYKPSFAHQAYLGTHNTWNNKFKNIQSSQISGNIHYRSKILNVSPGVTFTRLNNYVFFDQLNDSDSLQQREIPKQSTGNQIIFSPELKVAFTFFRHVTFSNQIVYTSLLENADDAIRVPELFVNSQLSYANIHFNGNLDMHAGVDIHWHSEYLAPSYDPAIRQFYNQDSFLVNAFPVVDIFLNAKVKRGRIFIKYNNLMQAITKSGYFPTPHYPGQRNLIDFGFDWSFYD